MWHFAEQCDGIRAIFKHCASRDAFKKQFNSDYLSPSDSEF